MSLILDALRKSEAERRRGQSPDLFAATLPAPGAGRPRRTVAIALAAVACLALAAVFLWPRPGAAPVSPPGPAEPARVESPQAGAEVRTDPAASPAGLPGPPSAPPGRSEAAPSPAKAAADVATPAPAIAEPPPAPPTQSATPAGDSPVAAAPAEEPMPPIAILAASERASLPPMKLSMHVWNSEAGKRFAIIDGQRIVEGSLLGNSVVEEIRRDGVVLNINGRRVLLSRP